MYDYQLVHTAGKPEFRPFSDAVPAFSYNKHTPFFQVRILCSSDEIKLAAPAVMLGLRE